MNARKQDHGTRILLEALRRMVRLLGSKPTDDEEANRSALDDYHAARMLVGRANDDWDDEAAGRGMESIRREALGVEGDGAPTESAPPQPDGRDVALSSAIRAITAPSPHEDREATHKRLAKALRTIGAQDAPAVIDRIVAAIMAPGDEREASIGKDRDALRKAAEAYFGVDFSKPEAP